MPRHLTPAERVERLRKRYGSHDKLRDALEEKAREMGLNLRPTRQTVIRWEQGGGIRDYDEVLAALTGSTPEAFRQRTDQQQFRGLRAEVRALSAELKEIRSEVAEIRSELERGPRRAANGSH